MTGEFSFALLPTDFKAVSEDQTSAAINAAVFLQFDPSKRDKLDHALDVITNLLEERLGLIAEQVSYGSGEGALFDIAGITGVDTYRPGYQIFGDHLMLATTTEVLQGAASIAVDQKSSLSQEHDYYRIIEDHLKSPNPLFYLNIAQVRLAVEDTLDAQSLQQYNEKVAPFLDPLNTLLFAADTSTKIQRASLVVTVK